MLWRQIDARLAAVDGDADRARALIAEAVDIAETTDALMDHAEIWMHRGWIEERLGDRDAARAALARSLEAYRAKGCVIGVERIERRLAALDAG
jgi:hypothetical protein